MGIRENVRVAVMTVCLAVGMVVAPAAPEANATTTACDPSFIGVPGSGQSPSKAPEIYAVRDQLRKEAAADGRTIAFETVVDYQPVPFYKYASYNAWNWDNLNASEVRGQAALAQAITSAVNRAKARGCPDAPILLAGYSQGAEVVSRTVAVYSSAFRNRFSVALFGDPSFRRGATGSSDLNSWPYGGGVRPLVAAGRHSLPGDVLPRTISTCASNDPVCAAKAALTHLGRNGVLAGLIGGSSTHFKYAAARSGAWSYTHVGAHYLWTNKTRATPTSTVTPTSGATGKVLASPCLNLRAGASGSSALIGCIPQSVVVSIQCTAAGPSVTGPYGASTIWDKTTWNGKTGYVSDAWVYTGTNAAAAPSCGSTTPTPPAPAPSYKLGKVLASPCLNFRAGASGSTGLIGCIPINTMIPVICVAQGNAVTGPYGTSTIWDRTTWNNQTGYVSDAWVYTGTNAAVAPNC
ncbi:MAG: cutinase family protein [Propionicimonas sp.]